MKGDRGQALIELVGIFPLCLACALALVEAGVVIRDQMAVSQAAGRAAAAIVRDEDPRVAAKGALPGGMKPAVSRNGDEVTVKIHTRGALLRAAGLRELSSSVATRAGEGAS